MKRIVCLLFFVNSIIFTSGQSLISAIDVTENHGSVPKAYGWNWMYTGVWGAGSNTNIGLDAAATWYAAIIIDLSDHIGDTITKIGYYHADSSTVTARVYNGTYQNPLVLLASSTPYTSSVAGWNYTMELLTPVGITSPGLYWIVLAVQDPGAAFHPIGTRTPLNTNAGKISTDGSTWSDLTYFSIDRSWLLGAYVYSPCPPAKNLIATNVEAYTAQLGWTDQGAVDQWEIEYGVHGFLQGSGITEFTAADFIFINGLSHSTEYDFYVRANCDPFYQSGWAGPYTFETQFVNDSADFLSYYFGFGGEIDVIDDPYVYVTIPGSPDVSSLVAHYTISSGAQNVQVNGVPQQSGSTANNFNWHVNYSIMAEDSITVKNWTVVVNGAGYGEEWFNGRCQIYPNPTCQSVFIETTQPYKLQIFDNIGKLLFEKEVTKPLFEVDIDQYQQGCYIFRIISEEKTKDYKVIFY